jgi:hypothetical protein
MSVSINRRALLARSVMAGGAALASPLLPRCALSRPGSVLATRRHRSGRSGAPRRGQPAGTGRRRHRAHRSLRPGAQCRGHRHLRPGPGGSPRSAGAGAVAWRALSCQRPERCGRRAHQSSGSRMYADAVPKHQPLMCSEPGSGLIPLGKSNTPEFGLLGTTESLALGVCRNPWNPDVYARRILRRRRRGGGRRAGAHRPRHRRRGFDPHSRLVLWLVRLKPSRGRLGPAEAGSQRGHQRSPLRYTQRA